MGFKEAISSPLLHFKSSSNSNNTSQPTSPDHSRPSTPTAVSTPTTTTPSNGHAFPNGHAQSHSRSSSLGHSKSRSKSKSRKDKEDDVYLLGGQTKNAVRQEKKREEKEERRREVEEKMEAEREEREKRGVKDWSWEAGPDSQLLTSQYGFLPVMQSRPSDEREYTYLSDIDPTRDLGKRVVVRARIDSTRKMSSKLAFIILRLQVETISAVLHATAASVPASAVSSGYSTPLAPRGASAQSPTRHGTLPKSKLSETVILGQPVVDGQPTAAYEYIDQKLAQIGAEQAAAGGSDGSLVPRQTSPVEMERQPRSPTSPSRSRKPTKEDEVTQQRIMEARLAQAAEIARAASPRNSMDSEQRPVMEVSEDFVRWAEHLKRESIVEVHGVLRKPKSREGQIREATLHDVELVVEKLFVISRVTEHIPFHLREIAGTLKKSQAPTPAAATPASPAQAVPTPVTADTSSDSAPSATDIDSKISEVQSNGAQSTGASSDHASKTISLRQELQHRVYDLRAPQNHAIFRIQSAVCKIFRNYLDEQGFMEIHTAKLQGAATEGGAEVFKVNYFGRPAFLAQSPQLGKQMAIAADMKRVYEIGPVFRAEDSNTHRHMTEFVGLDLEMSIHSHYHECMTMIDNVLKAIFKGVQKDYRKELDLIKTRFPHDDLVIPDKTVILKYADGVKLLNEAGHTHEDGTKIEEDEDFDTPTEKRLGALVKEKYNTDYYILDKFPVGVRPFYTMPDPEDPRWSNSFDIFRSRGGNLVWWTTYPRLADAGTQDAGCRHGTRIPRRIYPNPSDGGAPPHAGGGLGLERIVMLMLKLGNLRAASLYPRDPKSFPEDPKKKLGPRPRVSRSGTMPSIEDLIAAYGDSTNTSYTDPRYTIWRHDKTGAAVGYIPSAHHYAVIWGQPLCAPEDKSAVVHAWLKYCKENRLKPIWCCVDAATEEILGERYAWRVLSCVEEARVPTSHHEGAPNSNVKHKIKQATNAGVKVIQVDGELPADVKAEIEEHIKEWGQHRKGTQMHTTDVRPWDDEKHRKYFYAKNKEGKIVGLNVLAQLAPEHGMQIKWNLEFPDAPNGTSELMTSTVLKASHDAGVDKLTFGASASDHLQRVHNLSGPTIRFLTHAYNGVASTGNLKNKTDFRAKFGIESDPLYVAYPPRGLGVHGIQAIINSIKEEPNKAKKY